MNYNYLDNSDTPLLTDTAMESLNYSQQDMQFNYVGDMKESLQAMEELNYSRYDPNFSYINDMKIPFQIYTKEQLNNPQCNMKFSCVDVMDPFFQVRVKEHLNNSLYKMPFPGFDNPQYSMAFPGLSSLCTPMLEHSEKMLNKCPLCSEPFVNISTLKLHMQLHIGEKWFKCPNCSEVFNDSSTFKKHKLSHIELKKYACHSCHDVFNDSDELERHIQQHFDEKDVYTCPICNRSYNRLKTLESHIDTSHMSSSKKFKCLQCSKSFLKAGHLKLHEQVHKRKQAEECTKSSNKSGTIKKQMCSVCGKSFKFPRDLKIHLTKMHLKPKCNTSLQKKFKIINHKATPTDDSKKGAQTHEAKECTKSPKSGTIEKQICSVCGKSFKLPRDLKIHITIKHSKVKCCTSQKKKKFKIIHHEATPTDHSNKGAQKHEKRIVLRLKKLARFGTRKKRKKCCFCKKSFKNIRKHMQKIHPGENIHECSHCSKFFINSSNFRIHVQGHKDKIKCKDLKKYRPIHMKEGLPTKENLWTCPHCTKPFQSIASLVLHIRHQKGKESYVCYSCNTTLNDWSELLKHAIIHTGSQNKVHAECPICNMWLLSDNLDRHLKIHK